MCVVCMCICVYVYVYTCYVLTNPPIPSSRSKRIVILRPNFVLHRERTNQGPPPCNDLDFFFYNQIANLKTKIAM
jgi:hypothetical protein